MAMVWLGRMPVDEKLRLFATSAGRTQMPKGRRRETGSWRDKELATKDKQKKNICSLQFQSTKFCKQKL